MRWHRERMPKGELDLRKVVGGYLVQDPDLAIEDPAAARVATKRAPTADEIAALRFGWRVVKHVKSNAIVFAAADRTLGVGGGQTSRVDAVLLAIEKAKRQKISLAGSALASDAYFPFPDGVEHALDAGASAVIQPGGSVRDPDAVAAADARGAAMVLTGVRHFRH
jgi:phosphoribosylaminoimidazolecarboxamide formyltransferase / IMP cyclohydrolase